MVICAHRNTWKAPLCWLSRLPNVEIVEVKRKRVGSPNRQSFLAVRCDTLLALPIDNRCEIHSRVTGISMRNRFAESRTSRGPLFSKSCRERAKAYNRGRMNPPQTKGPNGISNATRQHADAELPTRTFGSVPV